MRVFKFCLVAALVVSLTGAATAVSVPSLPQGPLTLKFQNWDMGVIYPGGGGAGGTAGAGAVDALGQTIYPGAGASGNTYYRVTDGTPFFLSAGLWYDDAGLTTLHGGTGVKPADLEDAWFVFRVTTIVASHVSGSPVVYAWDENTSTVELVGIGYGLVDVAVGNAGTLLSDNLTIKLYAQNANDFSELLGSSGRTGFDTYTGLNTPGAVLVWESTSVDTATQPNIALMPVGTQLLESFGAAPGTWPTFSHTSASGGAAFYLDGVPGASVWSDGVVGNGEVLPTVWDDVFVPTNLGDVTADGYATATIAGYTAPPGSPATANWMFATNDPVRVNYAVPEPMTVIGLLFGVAGVGGYLRRRRAI